MANAIKVLKFGSSSLVDSESLKKICNFLINYKSQNNVKYAIIISAIYNITNNLIKCGELAYKRNNDYKKILELIEYKHINIIHELFFKKKQSCLISRFKINLNILENLCDGIFQVEELSKSSLDNIISFGVINSSYFIAEKLKEFDLKVKWKDSRELIIKDYELGGGNLFLKKSNSKIISFFKKEKYQYIILPGFIAFSSEGGSDYIACIVASALKADLLEIWTNVNGIMTADPKLVSQAYTIKNISYEEAMELSHFCAKIIYPPTLQPVIEQNIPIKIKSLFEEKKTGSFINHISFIKKKTVTGIYVMKQISLITLEGSVMVGIPGYSKRLFKTLSEKRINVVLITQSSSEHSIAVGIHDNDVLKAKIVIDNEFYREISNKSIEPLYIEKDLCIIAIVGENMKHGTSGKIFSAMGKNSINIRAIAQGSTEKNISVVIKKPDLKKALNILHEEFFETPSKQINLFIIGLGKVGSNLLGQINKQKKYLNQELKVQLRVIGLANSKKMIFKKKGININKYKCYLKTSSYDMSLKRFIEIMYEMNLRNSIFVDNTADSNLAMIYENFLKKGIGVITCNKIACSSNYYYYKKLKEFSINFNSPFLFETNVGASLPVISTLNDLINSGDKIYKIEAVLSGSLNFIFNKFIDNKNFFEVVIEAQKFGYTEPDPRIDLSGIDVMRKILILARECGSNIELENIYQTNFLPEECLKSTSIDNFYSILEKYNNYFYEIREKTVKKGKKLRFIAKYEKGNAYVGLKSIGIDHPFFNLEGKDNMVLYNTHRYSEQPLIIKGAGAGAEVTASGVLSDIIKASIK
ncbi:bifunctional aspartate kinase/homoserine dehydrogenase I [Candidatus Karelsulcia muelleri]|uniref:bifunctional aspartate kinase/homoserine dehydrogenase I n=1 Tax=Candidatus Karelsulcia muelleri TaxID=336810 RepID=UPI000AE8CCAC|nr:bifunctional aspartate kinase/homoserine dehydrogenase I [Candidatus Karelsulcia muelleri]WKD87299.1 bifunctional aspartate kinase/homoserine dehydrogenase I [Candidatus Karelsulcia muelleri]BEH03728.1 bifunctional aspartate kinase/homoserine dehydrogenase I [Candidatus Karelsulcia muelleri]